MSFSPVPKMSFESIYQIAPDTLLERGVTLLLLDLDNTLLPYSRDYPDEKLKNWFQAMRDSGITMFLVSNNRTDRAGNFAAAAGMPYVQRAKKPSRKGLIHAMELYDKTPGETALIGDQVYTDVLAANRAGVLSIVVKPIEFTNPALALRYAVEMPFRLLCGRKYVE